MCKKTFILACIVFLLLGGIFVQYLQINALESKLDALEYDLNKLENIIYNFEYEIIDL